MIIELLLMLIPMNFISAYILLDEQQHRSFYLKKRTFFICLVMESIILGISSLFNYPIFKTLFMLIVNMIVGYFVFHHKKTSLVFDGFFGLSIGVCELIILPILQVMGQYLYISPTATIWYLICSLLFVQLLIFYMYHIYQKVRYREEKEENTGFAILNFILLPIFSFINILAVATISQFYLYSWIVFACVTDILFVIYLNIYLSYIYHTMLTSQRLKRELALYEQKNELQYSYYQKLEENYQKSRQLIHDVKRHLQMLKTTEDSEYKEDFQKYLSQYAMPIFSNHKILNMILYEKYQEAQKNDIEFSCETALLDLEFMKDIDVTTIFLNLLDNAMDACLECKENRWIKLKADVIRDFLVIEIANSNEKILDERLLSSKKSHEGLGLGNASQALETYGGNMQVDYDERSFHVHIYLPMK